MIAGAGAAVVDWPSAAVATVAVPALTDGVVVARLGDTAACIAVDCAAVGGDAVGCTVVGCVVVGGAAVGCAAVDDDDDVSTAIVVAAVVTFDVVAGAMLDVTGAEDTTAIGASVAAGTPAAAGAAAADNDDDDFPLALMPVVSLLLLSGTLLMGTLRVWLSLLEIMVETLLLLVGSLLLLLLLLLLLVVVVVVAEVVVVPMAEAGLVALLLLPDPVPMPILLAPLDALLSPGRLPLLLLVLLVVVLVVLLVLMLLAVVTPPELGNVVTAVTPATVLLGELTAGLRMHGATTTNRGRRRCRKILARRFAFPRRHFLDMLHGKGGKRAANLSDVYTLSGGRTFTARFCRARLANGVHHCLTECGRLSRYGDGRGVTALGAGGSRLCVDADGFVGCLAGGKCCCICCRGARARLVRSDAGLAGSSVLGGSFASSS